MRAEATRLTTDLLHSEVLKARGFMGYPYLSPEPPRRLTAPPGASHSGTGSPGFLSLRPSQINIRSPAQIFRDF